jgi:hypothetical protein
MQKSSLLIVCCVLGGSEDVEDLSKIVLRDLFYLVLYLILNYVK